MKLNDESKSLQTLLNEIGAEKSNKLSSKSIADTALILQQVFYKLDLDELKNDEEILETFEFLKTEFYASSNNQIKDLLSIILSKFILKVKQFLSTNLKSDIKSSISSLLKHLIPSKHQIYPTLISAIIQNFPECSKLQETKLQSKIIKHLSSMNGTENISPCQNLLILIALKHSSKTPTDLSKRISFLMGNLTKNLTENLKKFLEEKFDFIYFDETLITNKKSAEFFTENHALNWLCNDIKFLTKILRAGTSGLMIEGNYSKILHLLLEICQCFSPKNFKIKTNEHKFLKTIFDLLKQFILSCPNTTYKNTRAISKIIHVLSQNISSEILLEFFSMVHAFIERFAGSAYNETFGDLISNIICANLNHYCSNKNLPKVNDESALIMIIKIIKLSVCALMSCKSEIYTKLLKTLLRFSLTNTEISSSLKIHCLATLAEFVINPYPGVRSMPNFVLSQIQLAKVAHATCSDFGMLLNAENAILTHLHCDVLLSTDVRISEIFNKTKKDEIENLILDFTDLSEEEHEILESYTEKYKKEPSNIENLKKHEQNSDQVNETESKIPKVENTAGNSCIQIENIAKESQNINDTTLKNKILPAISNDSAKEDEDAVNKIDEIMDLLV